MERFAISRARHQRDLTRTSVSFMHPLSRDRAVAFWRGVAQGVAAGERALLVAEDARGPGGTVQLVLDPPENQPHRADLSKMLVNLGG